MPMKPYSRVTPPIAGGGVSSIALVDSKGAVFKCNYVEAAPICDESTAAFFTLAVSGLGTAPDGGFLVGAGESSGVAASAGPSAVVGVTRSLGPTNGQGPAIIELPIGYTFDNVQIFNDCGANIKYVINYGLKIIHGQGWKMQLTPVGE